VATTYRYLAVGNEDASIRSWFASLDPPPIVVDDERGEWLHFREIGPIRHDKAGRVDVEGSPLVSLFSAAERRGVVWAAGEVHFLTTRLPRAYPALEGVRRQFERWIRSFDVVWDGEPGDWDYFLEGSLRNHTGAVYALPDAMAALREGTYFVSEGDGDGVLDVLCRSLSLRGVVCK
jgi:hypothetical protein